MADKTTISTVEDIRHAGLCMAVVLEDLRADLEDSRLLPDGKVDELLTRWAVANGLYSRAMRDRRVDP